MYVQKIETFNYRCQFNSKKELSIVLDSVFRSYLKYNSRNDMEKAEKIDSMVENFRKIRSIKENGGIALGSLSIVGTISSIMMIVIFSQIISHPYLNEVLVPVYWIIGGSAACGILSYLLLQQTNRKEMACYGYAASLLPEGELKSNLLALRYLRYYTNLSLADDSLNLSSHEKEKIKAILEMNPAKISDGICSQVVEATHCPCRPPCVPLKNVVT